MASIGTVEVKGKGGDVVFSGELNNLTVTGGRAFMQIGGGFIPSLPMQRGQLYTIGFIGVEGMDGVEFTATYEDYVFNAGATDYVDENVSTKVVKLIQSYTGVVNKMVWRKY